MQHSIAFLSTSIGTPQTIRLGERFCSPVRRRKTTLRHCALVWTRANTSVAEQVGIPPVYQALWELSGGPTEDDHALHEFVTVRAASEEGRKSLPLFATWPDLLKRFQGVTAWDYALSPNCSYEA